MEFNNYIKKMLDKTNLTKDEKNDMKIELLEHLNSMKDDFLSENHSENDAINLTLKNFNEENFLNEINELENANLKGINLNFIIKNTLLSGLIYCLLFSFNVYFVPAFKQDLPLYFLFALVSLVINFIIFKKEFNNKNDLKNNFILSALFFIVLERLIYFLLIKCSSIGFMYVSPDFDVFKVSLLEPLILSFVLLLIGYLYMIFKEQKNNRFNLYPLDKVILLFSIFLNLFYFLLPNKLRILNMGLSFLINRNIDTISKNILFITSNDGMKIFNLGLIILLLFIPYKLISNNFKKGSLE